MKSANSNRRVVELVSFLCLLLLCLLLVAACRGNDAAPVAEGATTAEAKITAVIVGPGTPLTVATATPDAAAASEEAAAPPASATAPATATPLPTATATPSATVPPPTATPASAWIVFASTRADDDDDDTSETDLFLVRKDGSELTQLTDSEDSDWAPDLSPDGQRVVFASNRDGKSDIYVINVDGTGLKRLTTESGEDTFPAWSPDGSRIAFISTRDDGAEVYVMDADGNEVTRVTNNDSGERDPAWSPDGTQIAYSSFREGGGFDIFVSDADGGNIRQVTDDSDLNVAPAWSPDGAFLVYTCWSADVIEKDRPFSIMTLQNSEQLLILYSGDDPGLEMLDAGICLIDVEGNSGDTLMAGAGSHWSPSWSADGASIVFASKQGEQNDIYIMDADGGNVTNVTDDEDADYAPSW